jgi:uncharacterized membrane protein YhaH (DUF805 family)
MRLRISNCVIALVRNIAIPQSRISAYWWRVLVLILGAVAFVLLASSYADAQCSMCRAALTAANNRFARNFNIGVLVLLVPPAAIFCSIFIVLRRHRGND